MLMPYLSGWRYRAIGFSVLVALLGYLGFSLWAGWESVAQAVAQLGVIGILGALSLVVLNYAARFARWQLYLKVLGHPLPWRPSLKVYLAGFALTTTPGKAGEALRGVLLKPWLVPYTRSFAAFVSERLSDLTAMLLLALWGLSLYPPARPWLCAALVMLLLGLWLLAKPNWLGHVLSWIPESGNRLTRLLRHLMMALLEATHCHRWPVLMAATVLSFLAWGAEALALHGILQAMGVELSLGFVAFVYAAGVLAGVVSFMPGGLGGTEAAMTALLMWQGVAGGQAVAAVILIRLFTLWFAVLVGLVCVLRCSWSSAVLTEQPLAH